MNKCKNSKLSDKVLLEQHCCQRYGLIHFASRRPLQVSLKYDAASQIKMAWYFILLIQRHRHNRDEYSILCDFELAKATNAHLTYGYGHTER